MKILLWIIAVPVGVVILFFLYTMINMVFIAKITEMKLNFAPEDTALKSSIVISEISNNEIIRSETEITTGDRSAAEEMLLYEDHSIKEGQRVFDDDPGAEVFVLKAEEPAESLVFKKNKVFIYDGDKLGSLLGSYSNPELGLIRYVMPVNELYLLVEGDPETSQHSDSKLWQVNKTTLQKSQLSNDPYFSFVRPPMVFEPQGFDGTVVVYYTGSVDYAFGGDSSRPELSVVRIYNEKYPNGSDIAKFGFKAGTVVDVKWSDDALIITGDPSRPLMAQQPPRPVRIWRVQL